MAAVPLRYRDDRGEIHETAEAAMQANCRISYRIAVERCTHNGEFDGEAFLFRMSHDRELADALLALLGGERKRRLPQ